MPKINKEGMIIMISMIEKTLTAIDLEYLEKRTKRVIDEFGIENLMDYTLDSYAGCDLDDFYKTVIEDVLIENTYIEISQISDGKYEIEFEFENKDRFYIESYAWDDADVVVQNLMENVIIPHLKKRRRMCA